MRSAVSNWATISSSAPKPGSRRGCWLCSGWASSRAWPMSSPAMPRSISSTRSRRSASATAPTWRCAATNSPPTSPSGRPLKSASIRPSSGSRTAAGSPPRRSPSPRCSSSRRDRPGGVRQRRARGGAARPALGQVQARHVQVRPRRSVHRRSRRRSRCWGWTTRTRSRSKASRSPRATSLQPVCPTQRTWVTGCSARRARAHG